MYCTFNFPNDDGIIKNNKEFTLIGYSLNHFVINMIFHTVFDEFTGVCTARLPKTLAKMHCLQRGRPFSFQ